MKAITKLLIIINFVLFSCFAAAYTSPDLQLCLKFNNKTNSNFLVTKVDSHNLNTGYKQPKNGFQVKLGKAEESAGLYFRKYDGAGSVIFNVCKADASWKCKNNEIDKVYVYISPTATYKILSGVGNYMYSFSKPGSDGCDHNAPIHIISIEGEGEHSISIPSGLPPSFPLPK